jgi:hypothetical protein
MSDPLPSGRRPAVVPILNLVECLVLAGGVRAAFRGWVRFCPRGSPVAAGLGGEADPDFSTWARRLAERLGSAYQPRSPVAGIRPFPLGPAVAAELARTVEAGRAEQSELLAAGLICAFAPYGQPETDTPEWTHLLAALGRLGIDPWAGEPRWRERVRALLCLENEP